MSVSEFIRASLQVATDVVSDSPFVCAAVAAGTIAGGVYFLKKKKADQAKMEARQRGPKPTVNATPKPQAAAPKAAAPQQPKPTTPKPTHRPKPAEAAQAKPQQAPQKPAQAAEEPRQYQHKAQEQKAPETPQAQEPIQEKTAEVNDQQEEQINPDSLYEMDPHEMMKKPKIRRIVEAFEDAHGQNFPADLEHATAELTMQAHLRMADLVNQSVTVDAGILIQEDLLNMAKSTNPSARLSSRYTNRVHSTRTFKAVDKASAKLILAMLATSVSRNHTQHIGGEIQGASEAIALIDECYARGVNAVYFYDSLVCDVVGDNRKVVEHQVRIMLDVQADVFVQTVVF